MPRPRVAASDGEDLVAQRFCVRGRRAELWTTNPYGDLPTDSVRWELRAGPTPEAARAADPLAVSVTREQPARYEQSYWRELSWRFRCPHDGLFVIASATAPGGTRLDTEPT